MDSSPEKLNKNDEFGEPSDSADKLNTETTEIGIQPECHSVEEIKNDMNLDPSPSNNASTEEIDINDIVLITESVPAIESFAENNQTIELNTTDTVCEAQASNQNVIELIDSLQNQLAPNLIAEKSEDEPIDIDEILNSLSADFEAASSGNLQSVCEASSEIVAEKPSELATVEKGNDQEIVLLSDDDEEEKKGRFGLNFFCKIIFCSRLRNNLLVFQKVT